jgi:hypothetical protein
MTDYIQEAEEIQSAYRSKRNHIDPFQDAVISFLLLFVRMFITNKKKER